MASFDIFLSHNSADKDSVERIAEKPQPEGVKPWLDKWCLVPGQPFQDQLANALKSCRACGIFVGQNGIGDWAREELRASHRTVPQRIRLSASFRYFFRPGERSRVRAAVVIGVNKAGNLPVLRGAASGALMVADWLRNEGFEVFPFIDDRQSVKVEEIFDAVDALVSRGTLDQLVIYFSGHGFISSYF